MKNMTKVIMASILTVGTLAAGCQTTASKTVPVVQTITPNALQAYNWQLVEAKGTNGAKVKQLFFAPTNPLILDFMNSGGSNTVALKNTCNNMSAGYNIVNGNVQLGNIRSTRMACPKLQADFDKAAMATVQGKYSMSKDANGTLILTIANASQVAYFTAVFK